MRENPDKFIVRGAESREGELWFQVQYGPTSVWYPQRDYIDKPHGLYQALGRKRLTVTGPRRKQLDVALSDNVEFTPRLLATRPGWCGEAYVMPDGEVLGPSGLDVTVVFEPIPSTKAEGGSLEGWRDAIAPLSGQALATFLVMTSFVPPLLRLAGQSSNFGIEVVGEPGCGKTTMQRVAATVFGSGSRNSPHCQCFAWQATSKGLEVEMASRQDQLYILDEAASFYAEASTSNRANAIKAVIFALSAGREKITDNNHHPRTYRFGLLSSSNTPLSFILVGQSSHVRAALLSRLITLQVPSSPTGIITKLPKGYATSGDFIQFLERRTEANHGYAFPVFIKYLVENLEEGTDEITEIVDRKIQQFYRRVGVDMNNGAELRVARVFALTYAAGFLAKRAGVLPASLHCRDAAVACYHLNRGEASYDRRRTRAVILELSQLEGKVNLNQNKDRLCSVQTYLRSAVFLRTNRRGVCEMMIPRAEFDQLVPDPEAVLNALRTHKLLTQEGDRVTVKRHIKRRAPAERVVCIPLV